MKHALAILLGILILAIGLFSPSVAYADGMKTPMKAFLLSFLVPGLGQYYAGSSGYAKLFITAELAIWSSYYYNTSMMDGRRQDYITQAALHAGANLNGARASYINAVGSYDSSFDYNKRRLQWEFNPVLYEDDLSWDWDSNSERLRFKKLRESELDHKNYAKFCVAGIILNHFLAGLNASNIARSMNERSVLTVGVLDSGGLSATFVRRF